MEQDRHATSQPSTYRSAFGIERKFEVLRPAIEAHGARDTVAMASLCGFSGICFATPTLGSKVK